MPSTTDTMGISVPGCSKEPIFYPPGTKNHYLWKCYPDSNLTFVGYGATQSEDSVEHSDGLSFQECVAYCKQTRRILSKEWNDLEYWYAKRRCFCFKNAQGHRVYKHLLHYRFVE